MTAPTPPSNGPTLLRQAWQRPWQARPARLASEQLLKEGAYAQVAASRLLAWHDPRGQAMACRLLQENALPQAPAALAAPAMPDIAWVSMVKDEADILFTNLVWHHALGIRKFLLLDNLSTDATRATVDRFARWFGDAEVCVQTDAELAYFQARKMSQACQDARDRWPGLHWILPIDADEFLWPTAPLAEVLGSFRSAHQAVVLPKSMYTPSALTELTAGPPFWQRLVHRNALSAVSCKLLMRATPGLSVSQGNHLVFDAKGRRLRTWTQHPALSIREFPTRSFGEFRRKSIQGGQAIESARAQGYGGVGGMHWSHRYDIWKAQGDAGLEKLLRQGLHRHHSSRPITDPMPFDALWAALKDRLTEDQLADWADCWRWTCGE